MDASVKLQAAAALTRAKRQKPTREEAEEAVRTLIAWAGDDPAREGLLDTPERVTSAYGEFFGGYGQDPREVMKRTFKDVGGYDDMMALHRAGKLEPLLAGGGA